LVYLTGTHEAKHVIREVIARPLRAEVM